ncbi:gamma-glutamylcyclotransferase family protein [Streptomyces buecherae]|uniref:Gamma-glutamylcyclotransferase n=1 Tax=Streptomyces buecherae TaxID=2763006 RepID=A0A7H8N5X2_9ACTN|nr:gamma-glutamylcyclotransferase family protein [Streptomyces buecherae]QKW49759.1 gamma-glutamylcyclotransferase [Streptomyces buecherae]
MTGPPCPRTAPPLPAPAAASPERLPFFVYGTLRPGGRHHAWALRGRTRAQEPARMPGLALYEGPGYPYAVETGTVRSETAADAAPPADRTDAGRERGDRPHADRPHAEGDHGDWVHGDLVWPTDAAYPDVLRTLDALEEYRPGHPDNLYERVVRHARRAGGESARAWVYLAGPALAARARAAGPAIAGGDWHRRDVTLGASFRSSERD